MQCMENNHVTIDRQTGRQARQAGNEQMRDDLPRKNLGRQPRARHPREYARISKGRRQRGGMTGTNWVHPHLSGYLLAGEGITSSSNSVSSSSYSPLSKVHQSLPYHLFVFVPLACSLKDLSLLARGCLQDFHGGRSSLVCCLCLSHCLRAKGGDDDFSLLS